MKVLLLSGYHAASHSYWCDRLLQGFPEWEWTLCTLPPRYFSWRIRGNSLSWAFGQQAVLSQSYDLVVATSMVDLASLRGFIPSMGRIPTLVYCHENQFAFPLSDQAYSSVEPQMVNLYTLLAADRVAFNSEFNKDTCLKGIAALLKKLPDQIPAGILQRIDERSLVLPVPVEPLAAGFVGSQMEAQWGGGSEQERPLRILWSGRHEYDKGPDQLLAILTEAEQRQINYRLALLGQQFKSSPAAFKLIQQQFGHRLVHFGYADPSDYPQWLSSADVFLSTALHEFQGIAAMQAAMQGCRLLLPDRLVYPEWAPKECLYGCDDSDLRAGAASAVELLRHPDRLTVPDLTQYRWDNLQNAYRQTLTDLATGAI